MNKNFKSFVLFLVLFGAFPLSCDLLCGGCGCGSNTAPKNFSIKDFQVGNVVLNRAFNPDIFYAKNELFKSIEVSEYDYLSQAKSSTGGSGFIQIATACSPPPSYSSESITNIIITNKKEWVSSTGDVFPIGTDISSHFTLSDFPYLSGKSISEFLSSGQKIVLYEGFFLNWNTALLQYSELVFDIEIKLSNGNNYYFEDEKMKIQNF
jgi:hypothetical protein